MHSCNAWGLAEIKQLGDYNFGKLLALSCLRLIGHYILDIELVLKVFFLTFAKQ